MLFLVFHLEEHNWLNGRNCLVFASFLQVVIELDKPDDAGSERDLGNYVLQM